MSSRQRQKQDAARVVREQLARERARQRRLWVSIGAVVVLVLAGLAGWAVYSGQRADTYTAPRNVSAGDDGLVVGAGTTPVELYLDFMCPHCKDFEESAGPILDRQVAEGKIKLVYHPVAFLDRFSSTRYSTRSAGAVGCAADAGKLTEYAKVLYRNQPAEGSAGLDDDTLIRLAGTVGIIDGSFAACVRDGRYRGWVQHVTDKATERGVNGTPTVYVNGKQVRASVDAVTAALS